MKQNLNLLYFKIYRQHLYLHHHGMAVRNCHPFTLFYPFTQLSQYPNAEDSDSWDVAILELLQLWIFNQVKCDRLTSRKQDIGAIQFREISIRWLPMYFGPFALLVESVLEALEWKLDKVASWVQTSTIGQWNKVNVTVLSENTCRPSIFQHQWKTSRRHPLEVSWTPRVFVVTAAMVVGEFWLAMVVQ